MFMKLFVKVKTTCLKWHYMNKQTCTVPGRGEGGLQELFDLNEVSLQCAIVQEERGVGTWS